MTMPRWLTLIVLRASAPARRDMEHAARAGTTSMEVCESAFETRAQTRAIRRDHRRQNASAHDGCTESVPTSRSIPPSSSLSSIRNRFLLSCLHRLPMSATDANSESLPAESSTLQSSLSREGSLYAKRGASIAALDIQDPTKPSSDVQPAEAAAASSDAPPASSDAASEGGAQVDASVANVHTPRWLVA
jgi:hypothetical protein